MSIWTVNIANLKTASTQGPGTSTSITTPGSLAGEWLIAVITCVDSTGNGIDTGLPSFPVGWNIINSTPCLGFFTGTTRLTIAYKISTGPSEPASYSVSWANSAFFDWAIVGVTTLPSPPNTVAVDQTAVNLVDTGGAPGTTTNYVSPSIATLSASNDLLMVFYSDSGGNTTYTMPGGLTTIWNNNQLNSNHGFVGWGYLLLSAANAGSFTATSGNPAFYVAVSVTFSAINFNPILSIPNMFEGWAETSW